MIFLGLALLSTAIPDYSRFSSANKSTIASVIFERCMAASGGVTSNIRDCSEAEGKRLDAMLNHEYRAAMTRLAPQQRSRLRALERQWIKTRYRGCVESGKSEEGGTIWLLMMDACGLAENGNRILWLRTVGR
ncbi:lysozyme inhibitor LprI family protein [Sphingomonas sp. ASV193]|uniref:lysozyme inhibitor LprI family protein n=1 Tax=Sphingomonas sp. ASV193 TaxID=3144405 RepID=UPI0032E88DB6